MCIILDANCFSKFSDRCDEDMKPVRDWVYNKNGKIAYSTSKRFEAEWKQGPIDYQGLYQAGKLKLIKEGVKEKEKELKGNIKSDDEHIIALALIAQVKVLVVQRLTDTPSKGKRRIPRGADPDLQQDFKNLVGGNIYLSKGHSHLLTKNLCPD